MEAPDSLASLPPYALPRSASVVLRCPRRGVDYQVMVSWPAGAVQGGAPHPVAYLLDGNALFATATDTVRRMGPSSGRTQGTLPEPVIVAIGYPGTLVTNPRRRTEDYTPPVDGVAGRDVGRDGQPQPAGGADRFLSFVEAVVKPWVVARFPVDDTRQALIGHSFGGLCVLYALLSGQGRYQDYAAISPSLWWGQGAIKASEARYGAEKGGPMGQMPVRLWLSLGGAERDARSVDQGTGVSHVQALADRLRQREVPGLQVDVRVHGGENHGSVVPVGVSRALLSWLTAG